MHKQIEISYLLTVLLSVPFYHLPFALVIPALQCFIHAYWLKLLIDTMFLYSLKNFISISEVCFHSILHNHEFKSDTLKKQDWRHSDLKLSKNRPKIDQKSTKNQPKKSTENRPKNQVKEIFGQIYNGFFFNGPK